MQQHLDRDALSDYLRGELDSGDEARIEEHIGSCLVCARTLQAEAQLEEVLLEAMSSQDTNVDALDVHDAWAPQRPPVWRRVLTTAAITAAAAAALLLVLNPSSRQDGEGDGTKVVASAEPGSNPFINDSPLCFPAVEEADVCVEPLAIATTTDPDDYLSPFDPDHRMEHRRGSGLNACLDDEDLTCDPFAG